MIKKNKLFHLSISAVCAYSLLLTGCSSIGLAQEATFESAYENKEEEEPVDIYLSHATVVIEAVHSEEQLIDVYMPDRSESRAFAYTDATLIQDQYGSGMSAAQLCSGDLAEIKYNDELEKVGSVTLSADAWSHRSDEAYSMDSNVKAFSEGELIDISQIIHQDVLTFRGKGSSIMSIVVDQGHGYLKLENDDAVVGGWIEVGQTLISQIAPDMLFVVPEGNYMVRFSGTGIEEFREVSIERNKETLLDLGDIEIPQPEKGLVTIEVTPESAQVFVDENKVSGNSLSNKEETANITISAPVDAEVYQDNLYMGIAPVTYTKSAGSHTITLRKQGYITKSYNIEVPDDGKDVTYAFPELEPENENTVSGNSVNKNTVSGNSIKDEKQEGKDKDKETDKDTVSGNSVSGNSVKN